MGYSYPKNPNRDYSEDLKLELDPSLWEDTGIYTKEQLLSIFGIYALRTRNSEDMPDWSETVDSVHTYNQNSYGYRDREYSGPSELIAAGCSHTFGQGVHEDGRWSTLLGEQLGLTTATLAVPGWGTKTAISAVMHHIKRYGKPKVVALLLPDFSRFDTITNSRYCVEEKFNTGSINPVRLTHTNRSMKNTDTPKYAKRPFPIDKVLNAEAAYFASGQALAHFSEYCKEAGINLVWATWDFRLDYLTRYVRDLTTTAEDERDFSDLKLSETHLPYTNFDNYIDMEFFYLEGSCVDDFSKLDCHQELRDKHGNCCFDEATDKQEHMGVHMHAHIADKFYSRLDH